MVWQRAGTVSVQNGSTTVTGAGVDFAASSRVGDSFVGPDGATYEVANVASGTVISILPAYRGATVSGASYAIMPVQGYDKMLSDAFNNLNNQFGPKLAALGTTGNYDILPVEKGGTGASNQGNARANLGLGSAATESVVTSPTDNVSGRLLTVGYMGVGGAVGADVSANSVKQGGFYRTYNDPSSPSLTTFCGIHGQRDAARSFDIMFEDFGNKMYFRTCSASGTYSSWALVYHTGNTTKAADGTLKAI